MKASNLVWMVIGVLALWGGTLLLKTSRSDAFLGDGSNLVPGLKRRVSEVRGLTLSRGDEVLHFERNSEGAWTLPDRSGYPADHKKLDGLVLALTRSEVLEPKTSMADRYASLGLATEGVAEGEPLPTRIQVHGSKGAALVDLWVGKRRPGYSDESYFVRREGQPQCQLASGALMTPMRLSDRTDGNLANVPQNEVVAARFRHGDGEELQLARPAGDNPGAPLTVLGLPADAKLSSEWVTSRFASALQNLRMDDVKPAAKVEWKAAETSRSELLGPGGTALRRENPARWRDPAGLHQRHRGSRRQAQGVRRPRGQRRPAQRAGRRDRSGPGDGRSAGLASPGQGRQRAFAGLGLRVAQLEERRASRPPRGTARARRRVDGRLRRTGLRPGRGRTAGRNLPAG
ncbi:MAG: DUF4340 domain-containing protein [Planctomycetota bacterium]